MPVTDLAETVRKWERLFRRGTRKRGRNRLAAEKIASHRFRRKPTYLWPLWSGLSWSRAADLFTLLESCFQPLWLRSLLVDDVPNCRILATLRELEPASIVHDRARSRSHHRRHQAAPKSLVHGDKGAQHPQRGSHCNPNTCTRRAAHRGSLAVPAQPPKHSLQRPGQAPKLRRSDRSALRSEGSFPQWARDVVEGDW